MSTLIQATNNKNDSLRAVVTVVTIEAKTTEYISAAKSSNTIKAYQSDWQDFYQFCEATALESLPATPDTVVKYLVTLAEDHKVSTLERRIASVSQAHQAAGYPTPTTDMKVRVLMQGIRRTNGTAQNGKAPVLTPDIKAMVFTLHGELLGIRDRALLLIGFAGGFRRSELVSLDVADLEFKREGLVITLRHCKTDQEGHGRKVAIPYGSNCDTCPVRSLQLWLEQSGIKSGPVFRSVNRHGNLQEGRLSDKAVALVVKRCAEAAGLDSSKYSGHSLRAGLATSAAMNGASERAIMNQTGHRSQAMVRRYIREANLFNNNAAASLGL